MGHFVGTVSVFPFTLRSFISRLPQYFKLFPLTILSRRSLTFVEDKQADSPTWVACLLRFYHKTRRILRKFQGWRPVK